ncbi:helix-turn-helix domain-containing protein [Christiangramia sediminis]|uniref:Helix-turn-helix transcriptional regulator n=1 Tax=Christiangramia sediminis TaxID=2881336 RepID=A0A9X1LGB4_9FLAO|nr:helix-turn-helix transcriptional regulator [Christiangramia sediminis]MCB7479836.1 helix-turn-helix transcriptional regulator [Christiangramia sediminis]
MNKLQTGEFYGTHYQKLPFENLILTDTEYTHSKVDWHYHENPYFTYLLQGKLFESNKSESYYLEPGSLLFHNWQDAHYNIKPQEFTRGFHIEMNENWFSNFDIQTTNFEGSINLKNPLIKKSINKVFIESKINDQFSNLNIDTFLIEIFSNIKGIKDQNSKNPIWVKKLQELLFEEQIDYSLKNLSSIIGLHPVHLSREFSRYFGTSLGNYIRLIKVNQAFNLIILNQFSMTEICYQCGFSDQSHFITSFKRIYQTTPSKFFKKIFQC